MKGGDPDIKITRSKEREREREREDDTDSSGCDPLPSLELSFR
jgi:hypothetical protein